MKYDYFCRSCNQTFEVEQRITAPRLENCVSCGAAGFERLIGGGVGIIGASRSGDEMPVPSGCGRCGAMPGEACQWDDD